MSENSFDAKATLTVGDRSFEIYRLDALQAKFDVARQIGRASCRERV